MNDDLSCFLEKYTDSPEFLLSHFKDVISYAEYEPNHFLTKAGEYPKHFFIILTGIARSFVINEKGINTTRTFFTTGDITGSNSAMMQNIPSEVNYQTLTKVTCYVGDFHKLIELTLKYKEFSLFYIKTLEQGYLKAEEVLLNISTLNATERYLELRKKIPNIDNLITQRNIASYLNISPVQLSRIRKKLLKEKNLNIC
ncbi:Crp/Fnr family transcriptional regulator [Tenacibaculum tangerinum]|uniref:Crp/Fnr family transcriptional regulator n=1 Tax=Tenacibaculum tangerinum TaxID=3038772 RepID=A0ABY8L276_9FLAO|nr:Crp/Fnr family transcriptional regulator [Tenacibaculum tangerinum]WGH75552.1 Crp/Fnr family transcriptional regulator [Tenacibaculum tangerinum]